MSSFIKSVLQAKKQASKISVDVYEEASRQAVLNLLNEYNYTDLTYLLPLSYTSQFMSQSKQRAANKIQKRKQVAWVNEKLEQWKQNQGDLREYRVTVKRTELNAEYKQQMDNGMGAFWKVSVNFMKFHYRKGDSWFRKQVEYDNKNKHTIEEFIKVNLTGCQEEVFRDSMKRKSEFEEECKKAGFCLQEHLTFFAASLSEEERDWKPFSSDVGLPHHWNKLLIAEQFAEIEKRGLDTGRIVMEYNNNEVFKQMLTVFPYMKVQREEPHKMAYEFAQRVFGRLTCPTSAEFIMELLHLKARIPGVAPAMITLILYGKEQGTGKDFFFNTAAEYIAGQFFTTSNKLEEIFDSSFTNVPENTMFVTVSDGGELTQEMKNKSLGQVGVKKSLKVRKFKPGKVESNTQAYTFTTNLEMKGGFYAPEVFEENGQDFDRRFVVMEVSADFKHSPGFKQCIDVFKTPTFQYHLCDALCGQPLPKGLTLDSLKDKVHQVRQKDSYFRSRLRMHRKRQLEYSDCHSPNRKRRRTMNSFNDLHI